MICYKDMTFCDHHKECKKGKECPRALTNKVIKDADKWWGEPGAPIAMYAFRPECFEEK